MQRGYLLLVLHAHLPYLRHPQRPDALEERWLFEAISECYLPLLECLERLTDEGVTYRLTLSLSPPLLYMLRDPLLRSRYLDHLDRLTELAEQECGRTRGDPPLAALAAHYRRLLQETARRYHGHYGGDLIGAFRALAEAGRLELITSSATHAYLPLLRQVPGAVHAQLRVAADSFRHALGGGAAGMWLPECGYYPGLEGELASAGFRYCFLETHGLTHARPRPGHGVQVPVTCPNGVVCFGRDPECSRQVWSREQGYPGHPLYREFHRDIGWELPPEQLGRLAHSSGARAPTGLKYHRITDRRSEHKAVYDPLAAQAQALRDADDFLRSRLATLGASRLRERPPLFVAPYDAELFGHWWYEGPQWLEQVLRLSALDGRLETITAGDYLERHPVLPVAQPSASSWGEGGYNGIWLGEENAWLYPQLHGAARDMNTLAQRWLRNPVADPDAQWTGRALRQAGRCLLLAQASDWPFMMATGNALEYATDRVKAHLARFRYLHRALGEGEVSLRWLAAVEQIDAIFPELDWRVFAAGG